MQNFGVTSKEHYGMLWYFLECSIASLCYAYEISFLYFFYVFHLQLYLGDLYDIYTLWLKFTLAAVKLIIFSSVSS